MKKSIVLFVLIFALVFTGCKVPFLNRDSKLSPVKFLEFCKDSEYEQCVDLDELKDDLDNESLVENGVYMKLTSNEIRKVLGSDALKDYCDYADGITDNLYSKDIADCALLFVDTKGDKSSEVRVLCCSARFESEDKATSYFDVLKEFASSYLIEDDAKANGGLSDEDGVTCEFYQSTKHNKAVDLSLYRQGDSVLFISGFAVRDNGLASSINEVCNGLGIAAVKMDQWDLTKLDFDKDRTEVLIDVYDLEEMSATDLRDNSEMSEELHGYFVTKDIVEIELFVDIDDTTYTYIDHMQGVYMKDAGLTAGAVFAFTCKSKDEAAKLFDYLISLLDANKDELLNISEGEKDSIKYFKVDQSSNIYRRDALYLEDNMVYLVLAIGMKEPEAAQAFEKLEEVLMLEPARD